LILKDHLLNTAFWQRQLYIFLSVLSRVSLIMVL